MEYISIILILALLVIQIIIVMRKPKGVGGRLLEDTVRKVMMEILNQTSQDNRALREEFDNKIDRLKDSITVLSGNTQEAQQKVIREFSKNTNESLERIRMSIDGKFSQSMEMQNVKSNQLKDSVVSTINEFRKVQQDVLNGFSKDTTDSLEKIRINVDEKLGQSIESQSKKLLELTVTNTSGMDKIRNKVDERLDKIQTGLEKSLGTLQSSNEKKLDEMRLTVDEKLEKTLETRLQKSFETVSIQLESVNKGLGEMKTVAESVGSLNKILSNSKSRGILGELQLGQIIEDMLPPQLYDTEVSTKKGSRDRVEYAIKLPGMEEGEHVYLPIDSKFPLEDYYRLLEGYEAGDPALIDTSRKALYNRVKSFAKDVKNKYISPPETTNFAVIFLPTEGLYSEVVRNADFFDGLRRDGILIAGPTTLSAMLNSLQVGFKTLQIQKGAAEIEKMLGAVKKEFEKFESVLDRAHVKITQAGNEIKTLVGTRTRAINRSLRGVQIYTGDDVQNLLEIVDEND